MTPVPLPQPGQELLSAPTFEETVVISRGTLTAAAGEAGPTEFQRLLVAATSTAMTGHPIDGGALEPLGAHDLAVALAPRNAVFRRRILQNAILCGLVLTPLPEAVADQLNDLAAQFSVEDSMLEVAREAMRGVVLPPPRRVPSVPAPPVVAQATPPPPPDTTEKAPEKPAEKTEPAEPPLPANPAPAPSSKPPPEPVAALTVAPPVVVVPPPAAEPGEDQQLLTLLADLQRFGTLSNDDIRRELSAATQGFAKQRTDVNRVRLAVLYTLLRTPQDDQRAVQLFDNVAKGPLPATAVRQLAAVLHSQVIERQRAVRDEQQKADSAIQKLEALREMERSLLRDRVRSGGGGGGGGAAGGSGR